MPGRKFSAGSGYRYGFNSKENDNEVKGEGGQQDYGMRIYDPRLGRFLSVDPITKEYPELTPYQFASNTPIQATDLDGLEANYVIDSRNYNDHNYYKKENRQALGKALLKLATATDLNDAVVITTTFTRKQAINVDGTKADKVDKGFAFGGAALPIISGSALRTIVKGTKWQLNTALYGSKVADAISGGSTALRASLEKAGVNMVSKEAHHVIPTQLLSENQLVRDAVDAGFDFNGISNGIGLSKVAEGGVHANHPNYTRQIREKITVFIGQNKNYTGAEAKEFLEDFSNQLKTQIKNESIQGGKKINELAIK